MALVGTNDTAPTTETQVSRELSILEDAVSGLRNKVDLLGKKLTTVMLLKGKGKAMEETPKDTVVPLASKIRDIRWRIEGIDEIVSEYNSALEL